jgi:glutamyl-tRNA reductase
MRKCGFYMSLFVCGINHHTAPLTIRERFTFTPQGVQTPLLELVKSGCASEAALLATCNRTEIICKSPEPQAVLKWAMQRSTEDIQPFLYSHHNQAAVRHVLRVASGLDSMVIGEPQILGQMKQAFATANQLGTLGRQLQGLFQYVFATTKKVRTQTTIGLNPVSLASVAVNLIKRIFSDFTQCRVLLIGAGATSELVARSLHSQGIKHFLIANRTLSKAQALARAYQGEACQLLDIPKRLHQVDCVIAAIHSPIAILGKGCVESALKQRKHKPVLMIDLAVPRNIEVEIAELSDVYLYTLDDIQRIIASGMQERRSAAEQAEHIIDLQAEHFMRNLRALDAVTTIRAYREQSNEMQTIEVAKALRALARGEAPQQVIQELAHNLTNKIIHQPCVQLRQAAYEGRAELLATANKLFNL